MKAKKIHQRVWLLLLLNSSTGRHLVGANHPDHLIGKMVEPVAHKCSSWYAQPTINFAVLFGILTLTHSHHIISLWLVMLRAKWQAMSWHNVGNWDQQPGGSKKVLGKICNRFLGFSGNLEGIFPGEFGRNFEGLRVILRTLEICSQRFWQDERISRGIIVENEQVLHEFFWKIYNVEQDFIVVFTGYL